MPFVGVARARLATLPVVVLALPWRCATMAPPHDDRELARIAAARPGEVRSTEVGFAATRPAPTASHFEARPAVVKQEVLPVRVPSAPVAPPERPERMVTLPDEVVVTVLAKGQPAFLRCAARASRIEGVLLGKVRLHLDVDAGGQVTASSSDTDSPELARCLRVVATHLAFPAPGQPAVVDVPLMFP